MSMDTGQEFIVFSFISFLLIAGVLGAYCYYRGRTLCDRLSGRFPAQYVQFGRPYPKIYNQRKHVHYLKFLKQAQFEKIADAELVLAFTKLRRCERYFFIVLVAGLLILGAMAVWYQYLVSA